MCVGAEGVERERELVSPRAVKRMTVCATTYYRRSRMRDIVPLEMIPSARSTFSDTAFQKFPLCQATETELS